MPKALSLSFTVVPSVAFLADLWVLLVWDHKLPPRSSAAAQQEMLCRNASHLGTLGSSS